ncbi:MAG: hypothetical protein KF726_27540, partial [Anaerolineae bacterium]|nr:hypothetical protein [Anaerolineae bacterium]
MLPPASRRHGYIVALSVFLLFSLLPLLFLSSQPSAAQGIPTSTPCYEMAFTGGSASTATPTSNNKTYLPCVATPTPGATLPASKNGNGNTSDTDSDGSGIIGAMSITTSVISDNYAIVAANDVSGVINAINTANQRTSTLPAYPIYLDSGLYVFNNTSAPFPEIVGKVKIFGSGNTSIQVSPAAPIRFRDTANAELHNLYITNNRTATEMYSGSMIVNGTVSIYDSWIADSYAAFGAGGIRVGSIPGTATTLDLIRVYFLSNYAGGGAAM